MNTNTRKICQFCRYKQCLNIGMRPKWVLSDDERHQKYGSRRKNKTKLDQIGGSPSSAAPPPPNVLAPLSNAAQMSSTNSTSISFSNSKLENSLELLKKDAINSNYQAASNVDFQMTKSDSFYSNTSPVNFNANSGNMFGKNASFNNSNSNEISSSTNSENDASPQQNSRDSSVANGANPGACNPNEECNNSGGQSNRLNLNKSGIDGIDMNNLILNSFEKDLIDRLSIAFYHSRKYNAVDLNVQKKLAVLFQTQNDGSLKKMSKVILANFIVQPVKRVITFAKLLHDFRKLDISDQMSLLQGGAMEIFICSSSSLYDQMANKLVNVVSKDRNIEGNDNSNVQLDILR